MIDSPLDLLARLLDEWEPPFVIAAGALLLASFALRAVIALATRRSE